MSQPTYTPKFQHKDWVDFVDPVQAGGPNGINGRFHALEAEFQAIKAVLDAVGLALAPKPQTLTLAPALFAVGTDHWATFAGFVNTLTAGSPPSGYSATAEGSMPVVLPDGAVVQSLRVIGSSAGGSLTVKLVSSPFEGNSPVSVVVQASGGFPNVPLAIPFVIPPIPQNVNVALDTKANSYYLLASLTLGNTALAAQGTSIFAFQIGYTAP